MTLLFAHFGDKGANQSLQRRFNSITLSNSSDREDINTTPCLDSVIVFYSTENKVVATNHTTLKYIRTRIATITCLIQSKHPWVESRLARVAINSFENESILLNSI